ncbi:MULTISPECIES: ABC transporter permease [Mesorhizobium]|nr:MULTISPECIES: ABC transporter permease [Mesorhizobium]OBQ68137.1 hypothetical protein A8146_12210 [Mesorhizobium loti]
MDLAMTFLLKVIMLVSALFLMLPVIVTILTSFDSRNYIGQFPPTSLSGQWYVRFWKNDYLWSGLVTSLQLAIATTVLATVMGALAALAINRMPPRRRDLVSTAFMSPLLLPGVVLGFGLLMFLSTFVWLPPFPQLLAGHLIISLPFTIRMTLTGLAGISETLREAALNLGANERQTFFTITLPLAKNGIAAGAIFAFALSMDELTISIFLSNFKTYTLPVALLTMMRSQFDLTLAAAAVVLMGLIIIVLFALDRVIGLERVIGQGTYRA